MATTAPQPKSVNAGPNLPSQKQSTFWPHLRSIAGYADGANRKLAGLLTLLVIGPLVPALDSYGLKTTLDSIVASDWSGLLKGTAVFIAAFFVGALASGANTKLRISLMESAALNQRQWVIDASMSIPMLRFDKIPRGDMIARITSDTGEASRIFTSAWYLCDITLKAVAASISMLFLSWRVGLLVLVLNVLVITLVRRLNASIPDKAKSHRDSLGRTSARALNILEGRTVIKAFLARHKMVRWFTAQAEESYGREMTLAKCVSANEFWTYAFAFTPLVVAYGYGGHLASIGMMTLGDILAILRLTDYLGPLGNLGRWYAEAQSSAGAYRRVEEFLETAEGAAEVRSLPAATGVSPMTGRGAGSEAIDSTAPPPHIAALAVTDLSFEYEPGKRVLDGISLEIPIGHKVALVGRSGSGKSTLLKVLAGLYPATSGEVQIQGRPLNDEESPSMRETRGLVTYTPQESFLFAGTIRENLEIAKESPTTDDMLHSLHLAAAAEFVSQLPGKLEEPVGEKGSRFSGGQRQRLSVARSFLRRPQVLLLDEPTSALDKESEAGLLAGLTEICGTGVTALIVTHRPRVAQECDRVLVLDQGRIVESGTHADLLERQGLYAGLFSEDTSSSPGSSADKDDRQRTRDAEGRQGR